MGRLVIGEGVLTWHPQERISNRYGTVLLMTDGTPCMSRAATCRSPTTRRWGCLAGWSPGSKPPARAPTSATRSAACGPQTPAVAERIVLGEGRLFCQTIDRDEPIEAVGCTPESEDDRDNDWLDPPALYRARGQTVRLAFEDGPDK